MTKHTTTNTKNRQKNTITRNNTANNKSEGNTEICACMEEENKKNGCNKSGERE
jgi:hypothetical protein